MKKLLSVITLLSCMTLFSACGSTESNSISQQATSAQQEQKPEATTISDTKDDKAVSEETIAFSASEETPRSVVINKGTEDMKLKISVKGTELTATLADSTAAKELAEKLEAEPATVTLNEYGGFEKVGKLPWTLTKTDESIVTKAGDIMLYQGNQMTIFYNSNSWSYTKLGHIDNITSDELAKLFGEGNITVTLSY
ncbi:cyclophilin-like fold protein [Ruminococcus albus]|uniref:Cyclophilin-like domain-containing protein n=1 Tax=Ruminococcus albus (strain ATCC 27210 / DSM 20455 / JCM 14654 / NCDO 2250 / 7) TaxID=697329 RepID=E6UI25_RUMA7|nr:cyclophilin-like fold protein [Ruminococcus albus]ADU21278.1 hypothetical protein Rumal_0740 [Ruminococcus albus 7 = DSM 20455]